MSWNQGVFGYSSSHLHNFFDASTDQVHFIFRHPNPITGEFEEKHLKLPPKPSIEKLTNLYTLVV